MKKQVLDLRDEDYTWWEKVEAYRDGGKLHLPRESVERIGELMEDGTARLINGNVEAKAGRIEVDGKPVEVWTVGADELVARPSRQERGEGRGR